ncbi:MAG: Holliday junction branch migration protein RuvA [bacterium]
MIALLNGVVVEKSPTRLLIEVNGIGYEVAVPVSTFEKVGEVGSTAKLLTYLHVREDALLLFGFSTSNEKRMFTNLLSVAGVGPKLALGILSGRGVDDLDRMIASGDLTSLTQISGVGKKTGQRIIMELRDKLAEHISDSELVGKPSHRSSNGKLDEAMRALMSLGYPRETAQTALRKVVDKEPDLPLDELIKKALQGNQ